MSEGEHDVKRRNIFVLDKDETSEETCISSKGPPTYNTCVCTMDDIL